MSLLTNDMGNETEVVMTGQGLIAGEAHVGSVVREGVAFVERFAA